MPTKRVLSVHVQMGFKFLACLIKEKRNKRFLLASLKILVLKFRKPHQSYSSVFPSLSLVDFVWYGRLAVFRITGGFQQLLKSQAAIESRNKLTEEGYCKNFHNYSYWFHRRKQKLYSGFSSQKDSQKLWKHSVLNQK